MRGARQEETGKEEETAVRIILYNLSLHRSRQPDGDESSVLDCSRLFGLVVIIYKKNPRGIGLPTYLARDRACSGERRDVIQPIGGDENGCCPRGKHAELHKKKLGRTPMNHTKSLWPI